MHRPIQIGNLSITFHMSRHETQGSVDLFEMTIPSFAHFNVPHLHRDYDETIIGMDGIVTWIVAGERIEIGPGQQLYVPRGVPHTYINIHKSTARMMCILTPGLIGPEYFHELAAAVNADDPPDLANAGTVMTRYGVIPASA